MNYSVIKTPICKLGIRVEDEHLAQIEYLPPETKVIPAKNPIAKIAAEQLQAYFADPNFTFDLPLAFNGTDFQMRLWQYLPTISAGTTQTYNEVAANLNTGARAIGNACRWNPLPLIFPCHRVVAKQKLGGFAGHRHGLFLSIKEKLLAHEGAEISK